MIITNRTCFTFKIPDEFKIAEKFRKNNPEAVEAYDTNYRSFVISNTYVAELAYTDKEIQMMQDLEQAEIQKAYELGYEEGLKEKDNSRD